MLGQSGRIVSGHVGDVIDVLLGTGWNGGWRFACDSRKVQVVPVATVGMPVASPPADGVPIRETAGAVATFAALRVDAQGTAATPPPAATGLGTVRMLRLTLVAPGVATLKGWHVQQGAPTQSVPRLRLHPAGALLTAGEPGPAGLEELAKGNSIAPAGTRQRGDRERPHTAAAQHPPLHRPARDGRARGSAAARRHGRALGG